MPATAPRLTPAAAEALAAIGSAVRARRKALRLSAVAAAEAAGISNVTLFRIEKGEPSVTMGAYMAAMASLGLHFGVGSTAVSDAPQAADRKGWIPARVRVADYPVLQQLAWQAHGASELTPREALGVYERNWRHVDVEKLSLRERELVDALREALGSDRNV